MSEEQIREDLEYLAGVLWHRGSNTQNERAAAEYVQERFSDLTPDTELDEFHSIETSNYLFAAYYGEFLVIALIALWFPWVALAYGTLVFTAYLAEFTGYRVVARLLPQFESQNVTARFISEKPRRLFVITAHYDTGKTTPLARARICRHLHKIHVAIVLAMIAILVFCATRALGTFDAAPVRIDVVACWIAVLYLLVAAATLLISEVAGEYTRGATDNASGVAALIALGERFRSDPLPEVDLWLVATGSHEAWMNGMRHLVTSHRFDKDTTFLLNLDHLGDGELRYTEGEGMLHLFRSAPEMLEAAQAKAPEYGASGFISKTLPSDALIPLTRGLKALTVTTTDDHGLQNQWRQQKDNLVYADRRAVVRAVDFAEATLRELARNPA